MNQPRTEYLYKILIGLIIARQNCGEEPQRQAWKQAHETEIYRYMKEYMPSGSGIDSGVFILLGRCRSECMVFKVPYHNMDEHGGYCGWTDHIMFVRPSLLHDFVITFANPGDKYGDKDMLHDRMAEALLQVVPRPRYVTQ